jgi:hypothetical protein
MNYSTQLDAVERLIGSGNLKGALLALLPVLREVTAGVPNHHTATQFFFPTEIRLDTSGVVFNDDFKVTDDLTVGGDAWDLTMSSTEVPIIEGTNVGLETVTPSLDEVLPTDEAREAYETAVSSSETLPEAAEAPVEAETAVVEGSEGSAPAPKRRGGRPPKSANPA